jgi:hypothetical protein
MARRLRPARAALALLAAIAGACRSSLDDDADRAPARPSPYPSLEVAALAPPSSPTALACPRGMMAVAGRFCVDKWEASLVDKTTRLPLSPYYPPDRRLAVQIAEDWEVGARRMGSKEAQQVPLPPLPEWQREGEVEPTALSLPGVVPNGYLSGVMAGRACKNAEKRLCRYDEWLLACEGQARRRFPYGRVYRRGACNTFRALHPAVELHNNPILGHHDPRLNLVREKDGDPLLRPTGATPECKSEWDGDAAWDMNGNLDEWVDDPHGRLMGGFFSRSRQNGCESSITAHPKEYFDYSTGTRCCWSPPRRGE